MFKLIGLIADLITITKFFLASKGITVTKKSRYKSNLFETIKMMPFIYQIDSLVFDDFVDIEAENCNLSELKKITVPNNRNPYLSLKENFRAIIVGNAGSGKTSLIRFVLISLLKKIEYLDLFTRNEVRKILPIYVPLKTVENSQEFPIIKHILQYNPYFAHKNGFDKMLDYAKRGLLFICLDGYDEIGIIRKGQNFISNELKLMFTPLLYEYSFKDGEYKELYERLVNNKIWVTSRKEFFLSYRIYHEPNNQYHNRYLNRITGIELKGLSEENIFKVVNNIIRKYQGEKNFELLSSENIINEVYKTGDRGIIEFLKNPLFLTVISFSYIKKVLDSGEIEVNFHNNYINLIEECIKLLIVDLDKAKARNLTKAQRRAIKDRRNEYVEEKFEFLQYFAFVLYKKNVTVFKEEFLISEVEFFFKNKSSSKFRQQILDQLANPTKLNPTFHEQLIFCGIFVVIDIINDVKIYDFPHRRFKEVLASNIIISNNEIEFVLNDIKNGNISELVYVVFFRSGNYQKNILELLLNQLVGQSYNVYVSNIIFDCIELSSNKKIFGEIINQFLLRCIADNSKFHITYNVIKYINADFTFIAKITDTFSLYIDKKSYNSINLICEILFHFNKEALNSLIRENIDETDDIIISSVLLSYQSLIKERHYVPKSFKNVHKEKVIILSFYHHNGLKSNKYKLDFIDSLDKKTGIHFYNFYYELKDKGIVQIDDIYLRNNEWSIKAKYINLIKNIEREIRVLNRNYDSLFSEFLDSLCDKFIDKLIPPNRANFVIYISHSIKKTLHEINLKGLDYDYFLKAIQEYYDYIFDDKDSNLELLYKIFKISTKHHGSSLKRIRENQYYNFPEKKEFVKRYKSVVIYSLIQKYFGEFVEVLNKMKGEGKLLIGDGKLNYFIELYFPFLTKERMEKLINEIENTTKYSDDLVEDITPGWFDIPMENVYSSRSLFKELKLDKIKEYFNTNEFITYLKDLRVNVQDTELREFEMYIMKEFFVKH